MKKNLSLLLVIAITATITYAQDEEFLWAKSLEISNCIEVGALTVDTSGNIIIAGVHNGTFSIPFKGDLYIHKSNPDGISLWTNNMEGELIIADMEAMNDDLLIAGEAYGTISYNGNDYGGFPYYMYLFKLDQDGNVLWYYFEEEKLGTYANLSVGANNKFILHARTESNQGDWIMEFDESGNILQSRLLHPTETLIDDVAYFNGEVYLSGDINGFSGITIDTIFIPQSPLESTAFVLALDNSLTGKWVSTDTTLNNSNGKIHVNENGVFVFQETLDPPFSINSYLKNFDYSGNLIKEVAIPLFSAGAALLPDMALVGDKVALFVKNSFSSNSFKVIIYNNNLELINEKVISGTSDQYSNEIDHQGKNFVISHVYESTLNLNDELTLPYEGTGKLPYIAKIGTPGVISGSTVHTEVKNKILLFPNPTDGVVRIAFSDIQPEIESVTIRNTTGQIVFSTRTHPTDIKLDLSGLTKGLYLAEIMTENNRLYSQKLMIR